MTTTRPTREQIVADLQQMGLAIVAERKAALADLEKEIPECFAAWAQREGILARVTEEQCADLALAYMAGWAQADAHRAAR